jgi:hypothetical protein
MHYNGTVQFSADMFHKEQPGIRETLEYRWMTTSSVAVKGNFKNQIKKHKV